MPGTQEDLKKEIHDRIDAAVSTATEETRAELESLKDQLSEDKLSEFVRSYLDGLDDNDPIVRKMKFDASDSRNEKLVGTKYARWGLTVADIEFLYDMQDSLRGQRKVNGGVHAGPSDELTKAFEAVSEAHYLTDEQVREIDRKAIDDLFPRVNKRMVEQHERAIRAMDTQESGFGQQLVGAQYVGDLWEAARPESRVFGLINSFEMTAPTAYLPVEVDIPEMLFVGESTANNSTNYDTVKTGSNRVQVDAKKFVIHQMWSGEMEEDSIIPFVPFLRMQAAKSLAHYSDSLVLNGDTTNAATLNINSDDADPADTNHYLAFDGLRHVGIVDNTANGDAVSGALTFDDLLAAKALMIDRTNLHDWGHPTDPNDLVYVADPETADQIVALDETLQTRYRNGGRDLLAFNGQVGAIYGHPIISSIAIPLTGPDGRVEVTVPGNNDGGNVVVFNRRGYTVGWRRRVRLETERLPATDQTRLVYSLRLGFGRFTPTGAASGIESAALLYDITL